MSSHMQFAVALSTDPDPVAAATDACSRVRERLGALVPTVVVAFVTPQLCTDPWSLLDTIHAVLTPEQVIGCTTDTVIADGRELEGVPALSLWAAVLPDVHVEAFRLTVDDERNVVGWPDDAGTAETPLILLADPFTFAADAMLDAHNAATGRPIIGGLASGGRRPGEHALFMNRDVFFDGAVGVAIGARILPLVSQGCEPIGPDMVITAGGGPVVAELAGVTAFDKIASVVNELADTEQRLLHQPLLAGLVIDENRPEYRRGDFLIRGIHGRDAETGAIYIGEQVRIGQTFRLHVRDAASAHDDLTSALHDVRAAANPQHPLAGLLFTCNGRGTGMFNTPDHDAATVASELGIPTAGMFCNGEFGPVGGRTFLHGFTATMAIFVDD